MVVMIFEKAAIVVLWPLSARSNGRLADAGALALRQDTSRLRKSHAEDVPPAL
jgi:hypothetical protein